MRRKPEDNTELNDARLSLAVRPSVKREMIRLATAAGMSVGAWLSMLTIKESDREFR